MKNRPAIPQSVRAAFVDWLGVEGYELQVPLAVNYTGRFLSPLSAWRGQLELGGTDAMLLASEFAEMQPSPWK